MSKRDNHMRKLSFLGFGRAADGTGDPDEVQLDAEMEKVFAGPEQDKEKFELSKLSTGTTSPTKVVTKVIDGGAQASSQPSTTTTKFDEADYDSHRKKSYPHMHAGIKPYSRSMKHQDSAEKENPTSDTTVTSPSSTGTPTSPVSSATITSPSGSRPSSFYKDNSSSAAIKSPPLAESENDQDEPQISKRAEHGDASEDSSDDKRVQFTKKGKSKSPPNGNDDEHEEEHRRRKGRHHHYKRKYSLQDAAGGWRRQSGSEGPSGRRVSIQPEDATLEEADIDELTSHRSDDPRGLRRHKVQPSAVPSGHIARRDREYVPMQKTSVSYGSNKKTIDRSPHEVFVQLDELTGTGEDREWKETARWIKYEEDVEEGADRWGKPHVASLSFHSLLNLRRCLETGVVLMDLEERDLPGVAYRVVEQMVTDELIHEDDKPTVMRALLLRHRHVNEHSHGGFHFGGRRKYSSYTSLQNIPDDRKPKIVPASEINGHNNGDTRIDMKEEFYTSSQEDLKRAQNDTILKRIPHGAEATTVLVGAVEFLEQPTIAFVRLAEGIIMPSITEVPIPVRFLFILLGPKSADLDYHEVGRSIATLMSNEHFHQIAYKADDRRELLSAINEFLDDSIVLPPGDWERQNLLPFEELKAKSDMIRSRKSKALKEKFKHTITAEEEKKLLQAAAGEDEKKPVGPLEKTHRWWGGLINDIKRRYPMYKSDIMDGLNTETLAATLFMYFAALSTAITFGGLASDKTFNLIGISETLVSCSVVGIFFHALAGQPLVIIGTTGPLLLFDEALYQFCLQNNFSFLTVRVYVGIWIAIIALVVSAFEGSVYVRLFTRFTQEIFSALITLIYIVETAMKLIYVYGRHPLLAAYIYKVIETVTPSMAPLVDGNMTETTEESTVVENTTITILTTEIMDSLNTTLSSVADMVTTQSSNVTEVSDDLLVPWDKVGPLNQPNTALFCTILTLGTFALAYYLKLFRNSHFLGRNARRALGDFGVPISIAIFVCLDYMIPQVFTDKLTVPEGLSPSDATMRGWLIPLGPVPAWLPFVCGIPAMLVYILIFMETHISELIVDKPERGLKKGSGLHMDIVLLGFLNVFCGFFGMPWHCAATVRSVTHVSSVTIMSRTHAPGDKPHITDVKEQRLSGFLVAIMVGLSVTMAPLLRLIPMSVLFGVFLYMGIASMSGVQFFERCRLFFMPVKHHPQVPMVRRVPTWKMHLFTSLQVLSLAILWTVKSSKFSLAFPFFLLMMVPLRLKMTSFFTPLELRALDGNQPDVDPENEPDFYEQAPIPA